MKCLIIILLITISASLLGCSTMTHIMRSSFRSQPDTDWTERSGYDTHKGSVTKGSFTVYNNNPYTLHLEIDDTNTSEEIEQLNGDGGASLNAYAACLTLKVIF